MTKCEYCGQSQPVQWDRGACYHCGAVVKTAPVWHEPRSTFNLPSTDYLTEDGYNYLYGDEMFGSTG